MGHNTDGGSRVGLRRVTPLLSKPRRYRLEGALAIGMDYAPLAGFPAMIHGVWPGIRSSPLLGDSDDLSQLTQLGLSCMLASLDEVRGRNRRVQ